MASGQQDKKDSEKLIVEYGCFEVIEEGIEPPPENLLSTFKTLQDWLFDMCDTDKPQKSIAKYNFGLFESTNDYTLFLVGENTYEETKNRSIIRIEFKPTNLYYQLPKVYYENLNREQLLSKLVLQLQDFTNTKKFQSSFFSEATTIELNGQIIWSK